MDQWNKIESPEISPLNYSQSIFNKRGKNIQWEKVSASGIGEIGQPRVYQGSENTAFHHTEK